MKQDKTNIIFVVFNNDSWTSLNVNLLFIIWRHFGLLQYMEKVLKKQTFTPTANNNFLSSPGCEVQQQNEKVKHCSREIFARRCAPRRLCVGQYPEIDECNARRKCYITLVNATYCSTSHK